MTMDEKSTDEIIQVLHEMKTDLERQYQKDLEKLFRPIDPNSSYLTLLHNYTKSELDEIRKFWNFKGISNLKKAELAQELVRRIPAALSSWLLCLNQEHIQLLEDLIANDGILENRELDFEQIYYFRKRGTLFFGTVNETEVLIMPQELIPPTRELLSQHELREQLKKTDELYHLTKGLLVYYGVIPHLHLYNMIEKLTNTKLLPHEFFKRLEDWIGFDLEIISEGPNIVFDAVEDPNRVLAEQELRSELDYYPLTKQQARSAGRRGFFEPNITQKQFTKYLTTNWEMEQELAELILMDLIMEINNSDDISPMSQLSFLQEFIQIDQFELLQEVTDYLVQLHNNTPQWVLKGYTPTQLSPGRAQSLPSLTPFPTHPRQPEVEPDEEKPQPIVKGSKIGRNESCPCGSGKKYKKCCGR